MRDVRDEVNKLGLEVVTLGIRQAQDIATAFATLKGRADALYVVTDPLVSTNRIRINNLALGERLLTLHGNREPRKHSILLCRRTLSPAPTR